MFFPIAQVVESSNANWHTNLDQIAVGATTTVNTYSVLDTPGYIPVGYTKTASIIRAEIVGSTINAEGALSRIRVGIKKQTSTLDPVAELSFQQRQALDATSATGSVKFVADPPSYTYNAAPLFGKTISISDGAVTKVFEFYNSTLGPYSGSNIGVGIAGILVYSYDIAAAFKTAVNAESFDIFAYSASGSDSVALVNTSTPDVGDNVAITTSLVPPWTSLLLINGMSGATTPESFVYSQQFMVPVAPNNPFTVWRFALEMYENTANFLPGMTLTLKEVGAVLDRSDRP